MKTMSDNPLDLWQTWGALVTLRAAAANEPTTSALLSPNIRELLFSIVAEREERRYRSIALPPAAMIEEEIRRVRAAIARAPRSPIDDLRRQYALSGRERDVLAFLYALAVSPLCRTILKRCGDPDVDVRFLIDALFPGLPPPATIAARRMFHPTGRLVKERIVLFDERRRVSADEPNILDVQPTLRARIVNRIVGDDLSYATLSAFIEAEIPAIDPDRVILAANVKAKIVDAARMWFSNGGSGLSFLFYGPSGTGKTLLAESIAAELRVPLVRMKRLGATEGSRNGRRAAGVDTEEIIAFILREARAVGGIAFFDECDDLFTEDSYESRVFLIELERHNGLTIMATNNPDRLDKALDRRATLRVPFGIPGREDRKRIWQVHLPPPEAMAADVDLDEIAERFCFAGGYIMNAAKLARLRAQGRPVTRRDLLEAAQEQLTTFAFDEAALLTSGAEAMPTLARASAEEIDGMTRAAADVVRNGGIMRVRLQGNNIVDLMNIARTLAWRLRVGLIMAPAGEIEEVTYRSYRNGSSEVTLTTRIRRLLAYLPDRVIVAVTDPDGSADIDEDFDRIPLGHGIFLHLDGSRRKSRFFHHFDIEVRPPEPLRNADLWREALTGSTIERGESVWGELAAAYPFQESQIHEAARFARWKALAAGRPAPAVDIIFEAAEEIRLAAGNAPLFGNP